MKLSDLIIEKPDWRRFITFYVDPSTAWERLDKWFTEKVEPINELLSEAVEVYGDFDENEAFYGSTARDTSETHKALLINIQPIEKDSFEKLVRDIAQMKNWEFPQAYMDRAKKLVEDK